MSLVIPATGTKISITGANSQRLHTVFRSATAGYWSLSIEADVANQLMNLNGVEINFIHQNFIYTAQVQLSGVDRKNRRCEISNIKDVRFRALRAEERVGLLLPCGLIKRGSAGAGSHYGNSRSNQLQNISVSGSLLSTDIRMVTGQSVLILISLDNLPGVVSKERRLYMPAHIVREERGVSHTGTYNYGVCFDHGHPIFDPIWQNYIKHIKQRGALAKVA